MLTQLFIVQRTAANDNTMRNAARERTVPIPNSITAVPGYPSKLAVYRIAASKFWQVRCWIAGRTHRSSTKTTALRAAQSFARQYYELLLVKHHNSTNISTGAALSAPEATKVLPAHTFGALAAQMYANEQARYERGEITKQSYMTVLNRLDAHILPRWASAAPADIDYTSLLNFAQFLSKTMRTNTVSQYLLVVRKVLAHAIVIGALNKLPEFPKIKISTHSRGGFTPTEYWQLVRCARKLRGVLHPSCQTLLRKNNYLRSDIQCMPPDVAWAIVFMVNSFIRPSDLKTLKHKHVEVVRGQNTYLRLTLPETKKHDIPIVTLQPAVRVYEQICKHQQARGLANADDYLFLPQIKERRYANTVFGLYFNWILAETGLKHGASGQPRSMYSLRHSAITFRLLYGQGIDLLTLARNARTSIEVINKHYASTVTGEQNIGLLQSRRSNPSSRSS